MENLENARRSSRFRLLNADLLDPQTMNDALKYGADWVFHFAAHADVRFGPDYPRRDFEQNTQVTINVLDSMQRNQVRRIVFSSTGSVYGRAEVIPTPESSPILKQTSLYGASKLAAEAFIQAYCESFGMQGIILRFVSILGPRYSHGHVIDFVQKLLQDKFRLSVLGNGNQKKSYLHVSDCIDAIEGLLQSEFLPGSQTYNLGTDEYIDVRTSIQIICEEMGLRPELTFGSGDEGWIGDNPFIFLDCNKIKSATGWAPQFTIQRSVVQTVDSIRSRIAGTL
jgi:UDP-glucose 4-epimerase